MRLGRSASASNLPSVNAERVRSSKTRASSARLAWIQQDASELAARSSSPGRHRMGALDSSAIARFDAPAGSSGRQASASRPPASAAKAQAADRWATIVSARSSTRRRG